MLDLNARMLYKVKFNISPVNEGEDMLWLIVMHIRQWQTSKYNRNGNEIIPTFTPKWTALKNGNRIFSEDGTVYIESELFIDDANQVFWACRITEKPLPAFGYAPRQWITEIGYEQQNNAEATLSCVLTYSDRAGFVGPYQEEPGASIPNIIKRYILGDGRLRVSCGPDCITADATRLSVGDWPEFEERIKDPKRVLPYIYISPYEDRDDEVSPCKFYIDPLRLAKAMLGNALVFYADDMDFTDEMRYMSPSYSCYGGALRVYQPNTTEATRHRYMGPTDLVMLGEDVVIESFIKGFAQNVNFYDSFLRIEQCIKLRSDATRRKRIEALKAEHQAQISQVENKKLDEAIEEERKRLEAEEWADELSQKVDDQKQKIWQLENQIETLNMYAAENAGLRRSLEARDRIEKIPMTREDVVTYFSEVFADKIEFAPSAKKSLKGCALDPGILWQFFYALVMVMWGLLDGGNGDPYWQFKNKTGYDCARGEGAETRKDKKKMRQFRIELDGEPIDIEPHLTFPTEGQSIHFGYSTTKRRIIIGHCGEHLDNYSTRKVH